MAERVKASDCQRIVDGARAEFARSADALDGLFGLLLGADPRVEGSGPVELAKAVAYAAAVLRSLLEED
jgi:hypothetical protein